MTATAKTVPTAAEVVADTAERRAALAGVRRELTEIARREAEIRRRLADGEDVGKHALADLRDEREVLTLREQGLSEAIVRDQAGDRAAVAEAVRVAIVDAPAVPDADALADDIAAEVEAFLSERIAEAIKQYEVAADYHTAVLRLAKSVPYPGLAQFGITVPEPAPPFAITNDSILDQRSGRRVRSVSTVAVERGLRREVAARIRP